MCTLEDNARATICEYINISLYNTDSNSGETHQFIITCKYQRKNVRREKKSIKGII